MSAPGGPQGTDHAVMRELNRGLVLSHIRRHSPVSRTQIAEATGLAKPTVSLIVEDLISEGLIDEVGRGHTGAVGGRPPVMLAFNNRSAFVVGIHVGVRRTTVVLADALADEVGSDIFSTPGGPPTKAFARIVDRVRRLLDEHDVAISLVMTCGICLPGLVSSETGFLHLAPNLGWRDVPVADIVAKQLGMPVSVHNGSVTSLVAEVAEGAAGGERDVVLFYAGTGVGAAALNSGVLLSGDAGLAGEIGHCRVRPDGERCNCGKTGCLETVASASAVALAAEAAWTAAGVRPPLAEPGRGVTARDVALAARHGDMLAERVLGDAGLMLGQSAATLVNILDPAVLVLAGGLAGAGPAFVDAFRAALLADVLPPLAGRLRIEVSALGQAAEVRGVLLLARERIQAGLRVVTS